MARQASKIMTAAEKADLKADIKEAKELVRYRKAAVRDATKELSAKTRDLNAAEKALEKLNSKLPAKKSTP